MPGPKGARVQAVVDAVRSGALDEAVLDEAVRRILTIVFKAAATPKGGTFDVAAHHALARKIAAEGLVLLKNDGLLPLQQPQHIAIIGRSARAPRFQGGGSSFINTTQVDIPYNEIQKLAGQAELAYVDGYLPDATSFSQQLIDEAVSAARSAEVAILFIALPDSIESEGYDRPDMNLTAQQVTLIKAVAAAQPRTVVVLNNASAVAMQEWIDGPAAVLEAWLSGQAGAGAIADILFGRINPSGKLTETFPLRLADTPAQINYPGELGEVRYGEGLFIGYRYYDARDVPVQFPFGYGLSYTSFAYSNPKVSATTFKDVDGLTVSVDVTNTGKLAGKEIVQLYVHDCESSLVRPPKELKGFAKLELQPGETKTVTMVLDFRAFAFYHPGHKQWVAESGQFELLIGASSADIRCTLSVTLQSTAELPSLLGSESTFREWLSDPRGKAILEPLMNGIASQMTAQMGNTDDQVVTGMDMSVFLMDMPVLSILHFQDRFLPASPEQMIDDLLAQLHRP
jgi:beta-glucosidase